MAQTPTEWLAHFPRYLEAASRRLDKLQYAAAKDVERARQIAMPWAGYKERHTRLAAKGVVDEKLDLFRYLVEELRVSLFAQELGTAMPVSWKRLEKLWKEIAS